MLWNDEGMMNLDDLFREPPRIRQEDICELLRLEETLNLARIDFEAVRGQLEEMLLLGCPVERGKLRIILNRKGVLKIMEVADGSS